MQADGTIDNTASAYIEAPVTLLGFSFSVTPADVTTGTIQFALAGQPTSVQSLNAEITGPVILAGLFCVLYI